MEKYTIEETLVALSFIDAYSSINESDISEATFHDYIGKVGLKLHKSKGILDYLKNFSVGAAKLLIAAVRGDKVKVKEIASHLNKEDVLDFLFKLDTASLHLFTAPIHFIDAVTGWQLHPNVKPLIAKAETVMNDISNTINSLRSKVSKWVDDPKRKNFLDTIDTLDAMLIGESAYTFGPYIL
jgi:hypothetical protein